MPYSPDMSKRELKVGDAAPDATVYDELGNAVELSSFWRNGRVLLVFIRHFG